MAEIGKCLVQLEHLGLNAFRMHLQHAPALGHTSGLLACVTQPCISLHLLHRHSRGTQPQQEHNPAHVLSAIAATAVAPTRHRPDEADPLVVAQSVYGQATGC